MSDSSTYWLIIMNVALGVITLICCGAVALGVFQEIAARRRKQVSLAALDHEVADLVALFESHSFHTPSLGVTMADGGEEFGDDKGR